MNLLKIVDVLSIIVYFTFFLVATKNFEKNGNQGKLAFVVAGLIVSLFEIILFFLLISTCACGYPLFSRIVIFIMFCGSYFNGFIINSYAKNNYDGKTILSKMISLIIFEALLFFILNKVFPENYHINYY